LRALRHAIQINPTFDRAYRPLFRILFAETRDGCSSVTWECRYVSPVLRDGDTIITVPRRVVMNASTDTYEQAVQQSQDTRRANLVEAREVAMRWLAAAPQDPEAHQYLGQSLLHLANAEGARVHLELAASLGTAETRRALFWDRMEALVRSDHGLEACHVLDEAAADPRRDTMQLRSFALASLNALLGRYRPAPVDSVHAKRLRARFDSIVRANPLPAVRPPSFAGLLANGDTNAARRLLARHDSANAPRPGMRRFPRADESIVWSAEQHLTLGDTTIAIAQLGEIERAFTDRQFRYSAVPLAGTQPWLGRAWLLAADLAAARGQTDDARRLYTRVVGLWGCGDAEVKPIVDKARLRLESLAR
jgi:tetratricopeptide (TPR) repeat protein